jgi:hypothetical protein
LSASDYTVPGLGYTETYTKLFTDGDTLLDVVVEPDSGNIHAYCQQTNTKDPFVCVLDTVDPPFFADAEVIALGDFGAWGNPKARWFNERWLFRSSADAPSAIYDENMDVQILDGDFDDVRWETCTADISKSTDGSLLKTQSFPWNVPVAVAELNGDVWVANSNQGAAEKGGVLYRINTATGRCIETLRLADYSFGMSWICDIAVSGSAVFVLGWSESGSKSALYRIVPRTSGITSGVSDLSGSLPMSQSPQRLLYGQDGYVYALLDTYLVMINPYSGTGSMLDLSISGLGGTNRDMVYGPPDFAEYGDTHPRMFIICNGSATGIMRCKLGGGITYEAGNSSQTLNGNTLAYANNYIYAYDVASGNIKRYTRTPTFDTLTDISSAVAGGDVLNINAFGSDIIYLYCGGANPIKILEYDAPHDTIVSEINAASILESYGVLRDPRLYLGSSLYVPVPSPVPMVLRDMVAFVPLNEATWTNGRWRSVYWQTNSLVLTGNGDTNGVMYRLNTDAAGGDITVTLPDAPNDGDEILLKQLDTDNSVYVAANTGTVEGFNTSTGWVTVTAPTITGPGGTAPFPYVQLRYDATYSNWDVIGGIVVITMPG